MQKIKVFLVDDHKLIRDGIKAHLEEAQDFEIVGEAADGQEAILKLKETTADVVLMDINMDGMDGISCTQILSQELPQLNVLALSMLAENQHIKEMIKAGAKGYLLKTATEQEIKQGIRAVYQGQNFYSAEVTQIVMNNLGTANRKNALALIPSPRSPLEKKRFWP